MSEPLFGTIDWDRRVVMIDTLEPVSASACWSPPAWERADRNPFPSLDPVPTFTRWQHRASVARGRLAETWDVLLHGVPERDEDDW